MKETKNTKQTNSHSAIWDHEIKKNELYIFLLDM